MYGETRDRGFGAEVKRRIILGTFVLSSGYYDAYYLRAQKVRTLIRRDFEPAFEPCDVVATPTTPYARLPLRREDGRPAGRCTWPTSSPCPRTSPGIPGLSVPCGFADGLPVGLQLLARAFDEATLFRAGHAYQGLTDAPSQRRPSMLTSRGAAAPARRSRTERRAT